MGEWAVGVYFAGRRLGVEYLLCWVRGSFLVFNVRVEKRGVYGYEVPVYII